MNSLRTVRIVIFATGLAAVALLISLIWMAASHPERMRIRNSLSLEIGRESDFSWRPPDQPEDFRAERGAIPTGFFMSKLQPWAHDYENPSEWKTALDIARHIGSGPGVGASIRSTTKHAYHMILTEERGYCADYTQVFNGLAYVAGVPVREWGMAFDDFGSDGHAFSEVFDSSLNKWIFIDTYYSFYVEEFGSSIPLSVLELREAIRSRESAANLRIVAIDLERFGFKTSRGALEYYQKGSDQFFLLFSNDVFTYDAHPIISRLGMVARSLEQAGAIALGIFPKRKVVPSKTNRIVVSLLFHNRDVFLNRSVLLFVLVLTLLIESVYYQQKTRITRGGD